MSGKILWKSTLLFFKDGLKKLLRDSRDFESEALAMVKLVKVIRQEIFEWDPAFHFSGCFHCQENSIPPSLLTLVSMLLNGPNVQHQNIMESQVTLTISQLIYFNIKSKVPTATAKTENPHFLSYIGLTIHTQTRSKKIANILFKLGIGISYDRILELENLLASAVCQHYKEEGVVCPPNLRKGLYTVGALDNIDHNPSSTTSQDSLHGTGMSIFQFPYCI